MEGIVKKHVLPDSADGKWIGRLLLSLVFPALILIVRPIGLTMRQSAVVAAVLLAIIW